MLLVFDNDQQPLVGLNGHSQYSFALLRNPVRLFFCWQCNKYISEDALREKIQAFSSWYANVRMSRETLGHVSKCAKRRLFATAVSLFHGFSDACKATVTHDSSLLLWIVSPRERISQILRKSSSQKSHSRYLRSNYKMIAIAPAL